MMGPYTTLLWNQMAVQDDCILVDNRLAVPVQSGSTKTNSPRTPATRSDAGNIKIPVVASHTQVHSESRGRMP